MLNLEGVQTRYENPNDALDRIAAVGKDAFVPLMQELYSEPVKEHLIRKRIQDIKANGGIAAVSGTPVAAMRFGKAIAEAGADLFFVQATVVSTEHIGPEGRESLNLESLCRDMGVPVVIGNCVTYDVALQLMRAGAAGVMVGIGPGAACTSRGFLVSASPRRPQWPTAQPLEMTTNVKAADTFRSLLTTIVTGGDICKCIACGADAVMMGSPIARAVVAPGRGFHWGMATPSPVLPRGTRIKVGSTGSLERILRGPAKLDDGTHNLLGALKTSMGTLGARTLKEMQSVEVVVAPSLLTEGKVYQKAQQLGMGK